MQTPFCAKIQSWTLLAAIHVLLVQISHYVKLIFVSAVLYTHAAPLEESNEGRDGTQQIVPGRLYPLNRMASSGIIYLYLVIRSVDAM